MGSQQLIYSSSISNTAGDGPWVDVGGARGSAWSVHIENYLTTVSVEVSNEIPSPTVPNPNAPNRQMGAYPPYGPPASTMINSNENHAIAATVTAADAPVAGETFVDRGVTFAAGPRAGDNLIYSPGGPGLSGTYNVDSATGVYSFNATDVTNGFSINLNYNVTTPNAGVIIPANSTYFIPSSPSSGHVLVVAKSDLNVKWVRVRDSAGAGSPPQSLVTAFLHIDK